MPRDEPVADIGSTAKLDRVVNIRGFLWTMIAFVVALCIAWVSRTPLLEFWVSPALHVRYGDYSSLILRDRAAVDRTVTAMTALLLTFPIFSAETWLSICRITHHDQARRLTLPFSVTSSAVIVLGLWLVRQVDIYQFIVPFLSKP